MHIRLLRETSSPSTATSSDDLFNWFVENNLKVVSADVVQSRE
jgi:hypothetical protein